jgi:prepilin-type N-terminal cleavage/methylation domain-containing protein/prepilin-type processing-associated H-X9-DG protein
MHVRLQRSYGFTLVELLVVIAIIAVLASLMFAGLSGAKAAAVSANCKSNLRQVGHAMAMYTGDTGFFPANQPIDTDFLAPSTARSWMERRWFGNVMLYCSSPIPAEPSGQFTFEQLFPKYLRCPGPGEIMVESAGAAINNRIVADLRFTKMRGITYGANGYGVQKVYRIDLLESSGLFTRVAEADIAVPAQMIAVGCPTIPDTERLISPVENLALTLEGEIKPVWRWYTGWHNGRVNMLFADTHVEGMKSNLLTGTTDASRRLWNRDNRPHWEAK